MSKSKKRSVGRRGFLKGAAAGAAALVTGPQPAHAQRPAHDHDDDHSHQAVPSDLTLRVKALESLLVEKGLVDRAALDAVVDTYEHKVGPHIGARIVAHAWVDPEYRKRLLADGGAAVAEFGVGAPQGENIRVLENTPKMHNLVVCTLCSCYPWAVLGLPPVWYKSAAYRSRSVIDPRGVLHELGLDLADDIRVRVWDSTADLRYLVLPERPAGTENLSENELAVLVTRDSMIGVAKVNPPSSGKLGRKS
jgi:nitrile hydratase